MLFINLSCFQYVLRFNMRTDPNCNWSVWGIWRILIYVACLFVYSYLPSITAASFCRGLSTIHTAAAGRPFKCAEVWKWCPQCFRTGAVCRDEGVFTKLQGNNGGAPIWRKSLTTSDFVLWQLTWKRAVLTLFTGFPVCVQTWGHRDRFLGRKRRRPCFKTLMQRNAILLSPGLLYPIACE